MSYEYTTASPRCHLETVCFMVSLQHVLYNLYDAGRVQCTVTCCADVLDLYEAWHSSSYRQKAIDEIYKHICADDAASHGISIGPVRACHLFTVLLFYSIELFAGNTCLLITL